MHFNSKWITYATGPFRSLEAKYGNPAPYFRKTFCLKGDVASAELLASAMGVYKIYINGKAIAEDYLSPGWVDYCKKMPYMRYDVTAFLRQENAIGVVLGDGWAVGHVGSNTTFKRNSYNDCIELSAQLRIVYTDGSEEYIRTDNSWKASDGQIRRSDIYMGEYVDMRLDIGDFSSFDYDDSRWSYAVERDFRFTRSIFLEEMKLAPIVVKHRFQPISVSSENGVLLFDVTQNIAGVLNCVFRGSRGAKVVIRHGELLVDGKLYTENLRKAEATDTFILAGTGEEHFRPLFTFHGFRYAEITLEGEVELLEITAEAMYTDLPATGNFQCSDPIVNKVYQNALWSQRDNFLNVPTDCPQRDERLGWTADAQIFCQSAMYNMDCRKFYDKYLQDIRDAQLGNGVVPAVAPLPHIGFYSYVGFGPAAGWAEAIAEIPYCHYMTYGDKKIIRDNLPAIKKLLDYYESTCPEGIRRPTGFTYGDWLSLGSPTDKDVVSTLYYARAAFIAAELCRALGDYEQARYRELFTRIKAAFRREFMDEEGRILSDTQSTYVIAYMFHVIDNATAKLHLERKFQEDDGKLTCGFLGVRFLLPTLCEIGRSDIAYRLITNREYPGWGYSVVNGATTIWEHWDSYTHENGIRTGMNSFNHYSFGSCTEWMYGYCLGIRPDPSDPGFRKVRFEAYPDVTGKLTWAEGHYDTDYGKVSVRWDWDGETVTYRAEVPETIESDFAFPGMEILSQNRVENCHTFVLRKK